MSTSSAAPIQKSVYNIPAGLPFARTLVRTLLDNNSEQQLADYTLLLPTRRACRIIQDTFLQERHGKPLLLPKIQPLGDVDEQDLSLSLAGSALRQDIIALPPAISPLRRRILLARTIHTLGLHTSSFDQALALGDALASFFDQILIEGLSLDRLVDIVPEEFAAHWQITLDFLKILSDNWPKILAEQNVIEAAERRNKLMRLLARHWQETQPQKPILAAGSTGSIPATAELLNIIASLPQGKVILPGLDQHMDLESWEQIAPSHPQYGLKMLLKSMDVPLQEIKPWPGTENTSAPARAILASEIMRPAQTVTAWRGAFATNENTAMLDKALHGLHFAPAKNQREEAAIIAMKFREILEHPEKNKTAALITADRKLARRVSGYCKRWGIAVDDSAGNKLGHLPVGTYLMLLAEAARDNLRPIPLLSLLKHEFCHIEMHSGDKSKLVYELEMHLLRGLKPAGGFAGLYERLAERSQDEKRAAPPDHLRVFLEQLEPKLKPFIDIMQQETPQSFRTFLEKHIEAAEALACSVNHNGAELLWRGEAGEAAAALLSELAAEADYFTALDGATYIRILSHIISGLAVRPRYGTHPRIFILGQLEARLIDADLIILGGLNEGSWPLDPGHEPWMSRPMRKEFGLPDPDHEIGLAAHDFVQGFCAPNVLMTRAANTDGAPSVPSRWLQRLDTVLQAAGKKLDAIEDPLLPNWFKAIDSCGTFAPVSRPKPVPPLEARPSRLSVTQIETWMKDPYAIYAGKILGLHKLEDIEKPVDASEKGKLLHAVLEQFIANNKTTIPPDALAIMNDLAEDYINTLHEDPENWSFWWPRFMRLCNWFIAHEKNWRENHRARPIVLEAKGELAIALDNLPSFTLSGIADRIDLFPDSSYALIDYKSSSGFTGKGMAFGDTPQLPLEAMMLEDGGFENSGLAAQNHASYLAYWSLTGGKEAGKITQLPAKNLEDAIARAREGLHDLISAFADPDTPYICLPRAHARPRFNDYEHLERVHEWAALDDEDASGEAA